MKTLVLAIVGAAVIAGPTAFAQPAPADPALASAKAKSWNVGDRMPGAYVARRFHVKDPAVHKLASAAVGTRWLLVEGKAYLIDERTDRIKEVVPLTAEVATTTPR